MPAVPPFATGNRVSITLWPVISGTSAAILLLNLEPCLTGLVCTMLIFTSLPPLFTAATVSSTLNLPDLMLCTVPLTPAGTIM